MELTTGNLYDQAAIKKEKLETENIISQVPAESWKFELEKTSSKYHFVAAWVAIIFNPIFSITDYFNISEDWKSVLMIRVSISVATFSVLLISKRNNWPSYIVVCTAFILISLQNAYTYRLVDHENILGHNLNYIALLIGAAMFLLWEGRFSIMAILLSAFASAFFMSLNSRYTTGDFFVNGGLLLLAVALFMIVLIKTRYDLSVKEIKARLALKKSNEAIGTQAEEIRRINENLERLVKERTIELERKNSALEEYAFINAHKLRSPVASILGLTNLMRTIPIAGEARTVMNHIHDSTEKLDAIVRTITKALEKGDNKF